MLRRICAEGAITSATVPGSFCNQRFAEDAASCIANQSFPRSRNWNRVAPVIRLLASPQEPNVVDCSVVEETAMRRAIPLLSLAALTLGLAFGLAGCGGVAGASGAN